MSASSRLLSTSLFLAAGAALLSRAHEKRRAYTSPLPAPAVPLRVELAVKMHCESCTQQVKRALLEGAQGVTSVDVDLESETVVVNGTFVTSELLRALERDGREARIVGTSSSTTTTKLAPPSEVGDASDGLLAAVVEFKGPVFMHGQVFGLIRLVQVEPERCAVQVELDGLEKDQEYSLSVHEYGDMRLPVLRHVGRSLLRVSSAPFRASETGGAAFNTVLSNAKVWELIGRAMVLARSDKEEDCVAAVIARSAGVGDNSKKRLCTCDGTVIWEAKY